MNKAWGIFLILWTWSVATLTAQIAFETTEHDFGSVQQGTQATYDFQFTNKGTNPLKVETIEPSCKCITPRWTASEVKPGKSGVIELTFDTRDKEGPFSKSISVKYNDSNRPIILTIKGTIEPADVGEQIVYRDTIGNLAFEKTVLRAGLVKSDQNADFPVYVKNIGSKTVKIESTQPSEYFELIPGQDKLRKGEEMLLIVRFIGEQARAQELKNNSGFSEHASFTTNESSEAVKNLTIKGRYQRVYTEEEMAQSPRIEFELTEFDGGEILEGQKLDYAFKFTNTGKSDLIIESAKASCGCTASAPKEKVIKPGQTSEITASFDSHHKQGRQHKTITVKSNDLNQPTVVLHLKCTVKPDPFKSNTGAPVNNSDDDPFH